MIRLLNIFSTLDEIGTPKKIIGTGLQHDVYPFKADPTKVIKIPAYKHGHIDMDYVRMFEEHPTITAKIFQITDKYIIMEKLDTAKFLEEDKKVRTFFDKRENKMPFDVILYIKTLAYDYPEVLSKLMKYAKKHDRSVKVILDKWMDFIDRLKETGLEDLDIHNGNLGYDKEGKLKLLDL